MDKLSIIKKNLQDSIALNSKVMADKDILSQIAKISEAIINCYELGGKVLFCGNGGSAADAQHIAAELSGRYYIDRPPLFAEALHVNTSYLTAVANDQSFDDIYSRLIQAVGKPGDILIAMSTSGNSQNIINACKVAKDLGILSYGWTGASGGKLKEHCDDTLKIPSGDTPKIQECHLLIGHAICEIVEESLFGQP